MMVLNIKIALILETIIFHMFFKILNFFNNLSVWDNIKIKNNLTSKTDNEISKLLKEIGLHKKELFY